MTVCDFVQAALQQRRSLISQKLPAFRRSIVSDDATVSAAPKPRQASSRTTAVEARRATSAPRLVARRAARGASEDRWRPRLDQLLRHGASALFMQARS